MKILQVTTFYRPVVGGVETQVEDLAHELIKKGHEVTIITTNSARRGKRIPVRKSYLKIDEHKEEVKVLRVNTWLNLTEFHKFAPGFFKTFQRLDYDVIHAHGIRKPELYMALLSAKLKKKRIIVSTHNPFTTNERSWKNKLFIAFHDILFGFPLMRFVDHYVLLADSEKSKLRKLGVKDSQMTVMPNAIKTEMFVSNSELSIKFNADLKARVADKYILPIEFKTKVADGSYQQLAIAVGRMHKAKGFQNLKLAIRDNPQTLFYLVGGDDGYLDELKQLFEKYENVLFSQKFLAREVLSEVYKIADLFLLPSNHEPFGIVLIEAMAHGCAVLATTAGGPAEILKDYPELLIDPKEKQIWADKVKQSLQNKEGLITLSKRMRKLAENYAWDNILPKYLKLYKSSK
jgi:glycosyltransferase involved in cell wall biosynthesis